MELVYLWVDKYKNIDKQGFNFSPRFRCEYDEEKNELTINENKDYISIFPDNINITAIVGENGSGKSSIIEDVLSQTSNHIIMYIDENKFYISSRKEIECKVKYIKNKLINCISLSSDVIKTANVIDFRSFCDIGTSNSNLYIKDCVQGKNFEILNLGKFQQNIYKKIFQIFKEKINLKFNFIPTRVILSFKDENTKEFSEDKKIFLKKLKDNHMNEGSIKGNGYEIKDFITNYLNNNKDIFFELLKDEVISVMLYDELERNIFHLSNGERKQFIDMILVYEKLKERNTNCLILLDEPDLGIHPYWQKKHVKELINIFSNFGKKLHFIITSHSPFILSDLPKENVIFLENGKQVYPFEDGKQTFGANIHTLLSHGFFMKDGLIGEFAKNKISKILNFLNGKNKFIDTPINQIKPIIELIGEDFLREKLLKMYDEKFKIKSKDDEIKELKAEIERLKNAQNKI
ncbi:AAA family ATPase [Aliarcobacter cryaerophilus]|uniref:AAA family ATPase n=1 Tax=Aliarcobacter cryaerophilus TaxID=28198 RepID=UPI0013DDCD50|nr:AAA family ATPase [Aliarcobacter cryaerophilus]